jgi:pimeloyl-ACP methyl ester carboxylesterase
MRHPALVSVAVEILAGVDTTVILPDRRAVPLWEGGDPDGWPVLFHSGTPSGRLQALQVHEAAAAAAVRLISFNRPGYGSAPTVPPGLASVGVDGRVVRELLGISAWSVVGISGGGPYAVASSAADPGGVERVLVVAGIGPWTLLEGPQPLENERPFHRLAGRGEIDAAWAGLSEITAQWADGLVDKSDADIIDAYFEGAPPSDLEWLDATARGRWTLDARDALQRHDGAVRDHLSWSGPWDIDPADVTCPVSLVYGKIDPVCPPQHGEWYAAHLRRVTLQVRDGAAHGMTCFTGWADYFAWLKG